MRLFSLTPLAEEDLADIVDYISSESSPDRAEAVLIEILAAADRVAERPGMGHTRPDLTDEAVLFWTVHKYLIVYRPDSSPLEIIRVVHGARDPQVIRTDIGAPSKE